MELRRRDVLKLGLFSSAALMLPAERIARTKDAFGDRIATSKLPKPFTIGFDVPPDLSPAKVNRTYDCYKIDQLQGSAEILPGLRTPIWGYNGITPGPTIRVKRGRPVIVRQCNELPARHPQLRYNVWTSTHLHGSASLPQYDGYASDITNPGQFKDYHYPDDEPARTLWTTTTASTTRPRTPTWGSPRCTWFTTSSSSRCRSRTAATTSRSCSRTRCSRAAAR
jgi:spore coat protein A, manganese oxidase